MNNFRHLHVHSGFSVADGAMHVSDLVKKVKSLGMDSVALTDHGNMYGLIDFYQSCKKEGIKPILGMEAYVAPRRNTMKESHIDNANYHLVLLCENNEGYQNLMKISSDAFLEGMYYRPRTDIYKLKKWHNGIIALSACLGGEVQVYIQKGEYEKAKETALLYQDTFGKGNYFLELQDHGLPEQKEVNKQLLKIHEETGIPLVCTNDCHYLEPDGFFYHDVLMAIQAKTTIDDDKRKRYGSDQFYVKSQEEMNALFSYCPEALENTYKIANRCNVSIEFGVNKLPKFDVPKEYKSAAEYLRYLVMKGKVFRYGDGDRQDVQERIDYELSVIHNMGYDDYFLIVWDFINEAHNRGILVGPGRGSAAGSIISYCLRITDLDPLKYNLMFERFLDPSRISMPDIDIDWQYDRRHEIIDYVVERYGQNSVCQIITFGTMAAKAAIRSVGRALKMQPSVIDKVAKLVPHTPGTTIQDTLDTVAEFKELYQNSDIKLLIDTAKNLEGLPANTGTHAAGVVICGPEGLLEHVPLANGEKGVVTQYAMKNLDSLGMLKMDFLGLKTLTVINETIKSVERNYGTKINMYELYKFEDTEPFKLLAEGKTDGLFQLEGGGMTDFMRKLAPTKIEDVIAGIALYRPGPMDSIPLFLDNMRHPDNVKYLFDALKPILSPTYGVPVYQEQAMQIVIAIGGYQKSQSDSFRKAIAKKKKEMIDAHRRYFINGKDDSEEANKEIGLKGAIPGAVKMGFDKDKAIQLYDIMESFGRYAFNKSHAAVYAAIGYVTMYLKYYYPTEFMAATIDMDIKSKNKVMRYVNHCKDLGISIMPPDINTSFIQFEPLPDKKIVQSLSVKDTDAKSLNNIITERQEHGSFKDMEDYFKRCGKNANRKTLRALLQVGAFDTICPERKRFADGVEGIYKQLDKIKSAKDRAEKSGRTPRITFENSFALETLAPYTGEYTEKERLILEKEISGSYLTGHPLDKYAYSINRIGAMPLERLDYDIDDETGLVTTTYPLRDRETVNIVAIVTEIFKTQTKAKKEDMAILTIEDLTGVAKAFVFPKAYPDISKVLEENQVYHIVGDMMVKDDDAPAIAVSSMRKIDETVVNRAIVKIDNHQQARSLIHILPKFKGFDPVYVETPGLRILLKQSFWVSIESLKNAEEAGLIPEELKFNYKAW